MRILKCTLKSPNKNGLSNLIRIKDAHDTLLDETKRRRYDSTLEFNDEIPSTFPENRDFFEFFQPYFARNAVWSKTKPVPDLGKLEDSIQKVMRFYDFWERFDSWREFTHEEEYDLSQAESRYEKRYMERENRRMKADKFKNERARIIKLKNLAFSHDPRVIKHQRGLEEEREARKQQKKLEREARNEAQRQKEEAAKQAELHAQAEALRLKEEEAKRIKMIKDQRKAVEMKFRESFLSTFQSKRHDSFYLDEILPKIKSEDLQQLTTDVTDGKIQTVSDFEKVYTELIQSYQKQTTSFQKPTTETKQQIEWSKDQINMLAKAVIKFPPGTQSRWERVAKYMGYLFSEDQLAAKALELKHNPISKIQEDRAKEKPKEEEKEKPKIVEKKEEKEKEKEKEKEGPENWSQDQQKSLEEAMKKFPNTMEAKSRWEEIGKNVPGKTMKDCIERFKFLKERLSKPK